VGDSVAVSVPVAPAASSRARCHDRTVINTL
jgi:hypothetical protein